MQIVSIFCNVDIDYLCNIVYLFYLIDFQQQKGTKLNINQFFLILYVSCGLCVSVREQDKCFTSRCRTARTMLSIQATNITNETRPFCQFITLYRCLGSCSRFTNRVVKSSGFVHTEMIHSSVSTVSVHVCVCRHLRLTPVDVGWVKVHGSMWRDRKMIQYTLKKMQYVKPIQQAFHTAG